MNPKHDIPLVRIGQGEYARDLTPADFDEPLKELEGSSVGLVILLLIFFVAGLVIGGLLW